MIAAPETDWVAHYAAVKRRITNSAPPPPKALPAPLSSIQDVVVSFDTYSRWPDTYAPLPTQPDPYDTSLVRAPKPIKQVVRYVAMKHQVSISLILDTGRNANVVRARQEIYWRLVAIGAYSLPQVGMWVGGRDHTTVLHGVREHAKRHGERPMPKYQHSKHLTSPRTLAEARGVEEMVSST